MPIEVLGSAITGANPLKETYPMEKKTLGMLYGCEIYIETDSEDTYREVQKWLETMDMRYRQMGEEKFKSDMAKIGSLK